jgi:hypothetical protein
MLLTMMKEIVCQACVLCPWRTYSILPVSTLNRPDVAADTNIVWKSGRVHQPPRHTGSQPVHIQKVKHFTCFSNLH